MIGMPSAVAGVASGYAESEHVATIAATEFLWERCTCCCLLPT